VKRHHDQGNSWTFGWSWLTGSEVQSIIITSRAWQCPGKHGMGGVESSTSSSEDIQEKTGILRQLGGRSLKPHPHNDTLSFFFFFFFLLEYLNLLIISFQLINIGCFIIFLFFNLFLGIFFIYISNAIPKVPHTLPHPLPLLGPGVPLY
jgi:hypothetical protein